MGYAPRGSETYSAIILSKQQAERDKPDRPRATKQPRPVQVSPEKSNQRFLALPEHVLALQPKSSKVNPSQRRPSQTRKRVGPSREKNLQKPLLPYQTDPQEEREQTLAA